MKTLKFKENIGVWLELTNQVSRFVSGQSNDQVISEVENQVLKPATNQIWNSMVTETMRHVNENIEN